MRKSVPRKSGAFFTHVRKSRYLCRHELRLLLSKPLELLADGGSLASRLRFRGSF